MQTNVDKAISDALDDLNKAQRNLNSSLDRDNWGYDEIKSEYRDKLREALNLVIQARLLID